MPDTTVSFSLGELAVRFGCELRGDPQRRVAAVASLGGGTDCVGFLANPALLGQLRSTRLGAVILPPTQAADCPAASAALLHPNPHAVFARVAAILHPAAPLRPGIHPGACVHERAEVAASAEVGPFALVEAGAVVGARCRVGAHAILGAGATLGADSRLAERATVLAGCRVGARCLLHPGVVVGADGFGNARDGVAWVKVPQLGAVRIGDDVEIGANTTIDRGALEDTVIGDGVRLDNQVQVAHNVTIGAHTAIAACVAIAGSTHIGQRCMIGGGAGFSGQLTVGDDIVIGGFAQVTHSLTAPGFYSSAMPVEEMGTWRRLLGRFKRLDALNARVRRLEVATKARATGQEDDDD